MRMLGVFVGGERACMACETERPASSISWSMEKAPLDINSASRAAADLDVRVRRAIVGGSGGWGFSFELCLSFRF